MNYHYISPAHLGLKQLEIILSQKMELKLSDEASEKIIACRKYLDERISTEKQPIYGVTTGFGSLCNKNISPEQLGELQKTWWFPMLAAWGRRFRTKSCDLCCFLKSNLWLMAIRV